MCIAKSGAPGGAKRSDPLRRTMRAAKKRHPPRSPPSQGGYRHTESVCAVVQSKTRNVAPPRDAGSAKRRPSRDAKKNTKRRPIARRKSRTCAPQQRHARRKAFAFPHGTRRENAKRRPSRGAGSVKRRPSRGANAQSAVPLRGAKKQNLRAAAAPCAPKVFASPHGTRRENAKRRPSRGAGSVKRRPSRGANAQSAVPLRGREKQNLRAAAAPCAPKSACVSTRHTARKRETSRRRGDAGSAKRRPSRDANAQSAVPLRGAKSRTCAPQQRHGHRKVLASSTRRENAKRRAAAGRGKR